MALATKDPEPFGNPVGNTSKRGQDSFAAELTVRSVQKSPEAFSIVHAVCDAILSLALYVALPSLPG